MPDNSAFPWRGTMVTIFIVLVLLFSVTGVALIYWGDEVASPSWNERSVPPPKTY